MKSLKTLIATAVMMGSLSAQATIVDLETVIQTMSKEDKAYFQRAVSLISPTENQDIKWKSKTDSFQFFTVFPKEEHGMICKQYQLSFASGGYSMGKVCEVSAGSWKFFE